MMANKPLLIVLLVLCAAPNVASGQTLPQSASNPQNRPQTASRAPVTAPVLRRQPRAADLPSATDSRPNAAADPDALEDEALNRKISGICRGC